MEMDQYKIIGRVGQGAHGYVMKAIHKLSSEEVALKKIVIKNLDTGIPKSILREIASLRVLNHENIVELLEVVPNGMGLVLVMEYLPINLYDVIKDETLHLNDAQIKCYMKMLLTGLNFMHDHQIMHRDLKPANLLISSEGSLKIADFGLARIYVNNDTERQYSHQVATRWYRAPELLYGSRNYNTSIDIWAAGCILAEIINKVPLFQGDTDIEQLAIVLHTLGTPVEESWPGLQLLPDYNKITFARSVGVSWTSIMPNSQQSTIDFIKGFIMYDKDKRFTAKKALNNEYFFNKPLACSVKEMPKPEQVQLQEVSMPDLDNFDEIIRDLIDE